MTFSLLSQTNLISFKSPTISLKSLPNLIQKSFISSFQSPHHYSFFFFFFFFFFSSRLHTSFSNTRSPKFHLKNIKFNLNFPRSSFSTMSRRTAAGGSSVPVTARYSSADMLGHLSSDSDSSVPLAGSGPASSFAGKRRVSLLDSKELEVSRELE